MKATEDILQKIIKRKHSRVEERKLRMDVTLLKDKIIEQTAPMLRSFKNALNKSIAEKGLAIIAELKKASPSKGVLAPDYDPAKLAREYQAGDATCLSVLTEEDYFFGSDKDLFIARHNSSIPVLRKDFIVDTYQIYESRVLGADCILLIAAVLTKERLKPFYEIAQEVGLDCLIEISNEQELEIALTTEATLIGINNRNLRNFEVSLEKTLTLSKNIPDDKIIVCESGIKSRQDIELMLKHNIRTFLIGESLVTAESPALKLKTLLGQ